jgi:signal transduction histidine kinase
MLIQTLAKIQRRICSSFQPSGEMQTRLRAELLNAAAGDTKFYFSTIFGTLCAGLAIPWVRPWPVLALWFLAVVLYPIPQRYWRRRNNILARTPARIGKALRRALAMEVPFHLAWVLYVPMCWEAGNAANNAFLVVYMMGSVTSAVRIYGPCNQLSLPVIGLYLPFVAFYTLKTGTYMDFAMPVLQVAFLGMLVLLAQHHFWTFHESIGRLITIEGLVKNLAEARDEAERANKAKSAFLASMSHELRTPLNAIIGFSDMIRQSIFGPVTPVKYREYADDIYASGQHLLDLINDVLDLSKIEAGKRELKDSQIVVETLAENAALFVSPQAQNVDIKILIDVPPGLKLVADERAISQVLVNFLSNAIKFSPKGETVTIFARRTDRGGLSLGVVDHGIGMDDDGIKKALEPYGQVSLTTLDNHGTGLGLPIAKALVEAHDAIFHIESAAGSGTTVWCEFPPSRIPV